MPKRPQLQTRLSLPVTYHYSLHAEAEAAASAPSAHLSLAATQQVFQGAAAANSVTLAEMAPDRAFIVQRLDQLGDTFRAFFWTQLDRSALTQGSRDEPRSTTSEHVSGNKSPGEAHQQCQ